jgi:hypothetical protein
VEIGRECFGLNPSAVSPSEFLRADLRVLIDCEAIALLPGWEFSMSARAEAVVAVSLGHTFYDALSGEECPRPALIEIHGGYEMSATLPASRVVHPEGGES